MSQRLGLVPSDEVQSSLISDSYVGGKLCQQEDLVLNRLKAHLGVFALAKQPGVISPDYSVFRRKRPLNMTYSEQVLRSPACRGELRIRAKGIVEGFWRLYTDDFFDIRLPLPPLPEQATIVRYLDHVDRQVRRFVRAKQKLIGLLEEQKQAIIQRAVTRGLDPDVPLKPSGVEWLGEVPEHWEVLRTKYVFREVDRRSTTGEETHLSMSQKLGLVPSDMVQSTLTSESYVGGKLCEADDLVLNRLKAHLGVFALAKQAGVISPDYTVFRMKRPINTTYFELVLRSPACRRELRIRAKGIVEGFWRLYTDDFYDIRVPVPSVPQQDLIIAKLDQATADIDTTIARANREIELLNEYRIRLIADVVTGKLDVREVAANLPDEPDEPEPLDEADDLRNTEEEMADDLDAIPEEVEA